MKRMVENSEKIEELADAVENSATTLSFKKQVNFDENVNVYGVARYNNGLEVNNGDLVTSNITTTNGENLYIFKNTDYSISSDFPGTVMVINLGTALLIKATIKSGTPTDSYYILTINKDYQEFQYFQISNGKEFITGIESDVGLFMITTDFNETKADHTRPEYSLIYIVGHNGVQS